MLLSPYLIELFTCGTHRSMNAGNGGGGGGKKIPIFFIETSTYFRCVKNELLTNSLLYGNPKVCCNLWLQLSIFTAWKPKSLL